MSGTGGAPGLRTPSLRRRVTLVVVALVAVLLVVLVAATELALRERLDDQLRQRLVERAGVADALVGEVDDRDLARRLEGEGVSAVVRTADGEVYAEGPLAGAAGVAPGDGEDASEGSGGTGGDSGAGEGPADGGPPGPATVPSPLRGDPGPPDPPGATPAVQESGDLLTVSRSLADGSTLLLLADASDVRETVAQVRLVLFVTAVAVLLATALVVPLVVGGALRPLRRITDVARSITRGDRGRRLRPTTPGTDLGRTALAFDEMLDEVVGAEARAVDSEARLRDFVSDAAHELRTPVTGIRAAAEHVLRADPPREEREQVLVDLIREAQRAGRLVDDLLLMARIDRGLALVTGPVDLRSVAEEVARSPRPGPAVVRVAGGPVVAAADRDRVVQVLGNLVDNAVQAGARQVELRSSYDGDAAVVEVVDDGPGIPAADRERVFDRLVRLDPARERRAGGSGLGLSIARGLARAHGGDLVCREPAGGAGTRMRLTLPAGATEDGPVGAATTPRG
ncbi:sensor histidine kinase [Nocardioides kribbensis]|uniref:histidine kinase n=2 Tax=Nocardioides kribbensis TaxID=305517 RepID=A0ABV1NYW5_9ACTN